MSNLSPEEVNAVLARSLSFIGRVVRNVAITPRMRRITVTSEALRDLGTDVGPDSAIRLYLPVPGERVAAADEPNSPLNPANRPKPADFNDPSVGSVAPRPWTIRNFDPDTLELDLEFFQFQGDGVARRFGEEAREGDEIGLWIPKGASLLQPPAEIDCYILAGDETALPGIMGTLEHLPAGTRAFAFCEVVDAGEEQVCETKADARITWLHRGATPAGQSGLIEKALRAMDWPEGKVFVYVCSELKETKPIRRHVREDRKVDRAYCHVVTYWTRSLDAEDMFYKADPASFDRDSY